MTLKTNNIHYVDKCLELQVYTYKYSVTKYNLSHAREQSYRNEKSFMIIGWNVKKDGAILNHWGQVKHICISKTYNGLSPGQCQTIICTK